MKLLVGFVEIGLQTYQMERIERAAMDALIARPDIREWPLRYDDSRRVFPTPPRDAVVWFTEG